MSGHRIFEDIRNAILAGDMRTLPVPCPADGTVWHLWVDDDGDLRVHDDPWIDEATSDLLGTVVGAQTAPE